MAKQRKTETVGPKKAGVKDVTPKKKSKKDSD